MASTAPNHDELGKNFGSQSGINLAQCREVVTIEEGHLFFQTIQMLCTRRKGEGKGEEDEERGLVVNFDALYNLPAGLKTSHHLG